MKICVFGASGGIGQKIVELALTDGHFVTAVYRKTPERPSHPNLKILVSSDVLDKKFIARALEGSEVVISALGLRRKHPANPWSKITSPKDLTSSFASLLVDLAAETKPSPRLIAISAGGVRDSWPRVARALQVLFKHSSIGTGYKDLNKMEDVFEKSKTDWLCVRPTTLTNGTLTKKVKLTGFYKSVSKISRADVAWFILQSLKGPLDTRTPMIET
jgi:putative NADH-flavin reductase